MAVEDLNKWALPWKAGGTRRRMSRLTRDGTAEPVSRDKILRHKRGQGDVNFPCSEVGVGAKKHAIFCPWRDLTRQQVPPALELP